jgi:hypothetical protein
MLAALRASLRVGPTRQDDIHTRRSVMLLEAVKPAAILNRPNPFGFVFHEIAELARAELRRSSYTELRDVDCDFSGGILTLSGRVPSFHLKQMAQTVVADVRGVMEIDNLLEVG